MSHNYDNTLFSVFTLSVFYNLTPSKNSKLLSSLQTAVCSLPAWSERVLVCLEINCRFAKFLCFLLFVITTKQVHLLYQQPNLDGVLFTSKYYWNTKQLTVISLSLCVWRIDWTKCITAELLHDFIELRKEYEERVHKCCSYKIVILSFNSLIFIARFEIKFSFFVSSQILICLVFLCSWMTFIYKCNCSGGRPHNLTQTVRVFEEYSVEMRVASHNILEVFKYFWIDIVT